ncbi:hypothetical protein QTP88_011781 [Uroleucon formosanum]
MFNVSWIRHRDIHLLTAGRYTYTSDQRFEAIHEPHSENWSLRIKYPQKKDSGIYECQISTTPPIGHPVYLTVLDIMDVDMYSDMKTQAQKGKQVECKLGDPRYPIKQTACESVLSYGDTRP